MKQKTVQILFLVFFDVLATAITFFFLISVLSGDLNRVKSGPVFLLVFFLFFIVQSIFLLFKLVKSLARNSWKVSIWALVLLFLLGFAIYWVLFTLMLYAGVIGNYLEGF